MSTSAIFTLFGLMLAGMASPGPDLFLILRVATKSRRHAVAAAFGVCFGSLIWISLTVFGIAAVLVARPSLMAGIQVLGGAYLGWMGYSMLRTGIISLRQMQHSAAHADVGSVAKLKSPRTYLIQGLFTNLSNPKAVLFFTAVMTPFVPVEAPAWFLAGLAGLLFAMTLAFFMPVALLVSSKRIVRHFLAAGPYIDIVAGCLFALISIVFVIQGVGGLFS